MQSKHFKVGDLVRFKLDKRGFLYTGEGEDKSRELYPYKYEIGLVTGHDYNRAIISFPSRLIAPLPHNLEVL